MWSKQQTLTETPAPSPAQPSASTVTPFTAPDRSPSSVSELAMPLGAKDFATPTICTPCIRKQTSNSSVVSCAMLK